MSLFTSNTMTQQSFSNQPSSLLTANNVGGGFGNSNFNNSTFAFNPQTPQKGKQYFEYYCGYRWQFAARSRPEHQSKWNI